MNHTFSQREKILLVILTFLVIGIGYYKFIFEPINNQVNTYNYEKAGEQAEIEANMPLMARMNMMRQELERIYSEGEPSSMMVYDNSVALMVELYDILDESYDYSLTFGELSLSKGSKNIMARPISIFYKVDTIETAYRIFDKLYYNENFNRISDVSILNGKNILGDGVQVSLTITFYEVIA